MRKVTNKSIARIFRRLGFIREVDGKEWSARSYFTAANMAEVHHLPIRDLSQTEIQAISGFGAKLASVAAEVAQGRVPDEVAKDLNRYPESLCDLTQVPGIGPRRAVHIFEEHGVRNIQELHKLAKQGKFDEGLRKAIEFTVNSKGRRLDFDEAFSIAKKVRRGILRGKVKDALREEGLGEIRCRIVGSIRRKTRTIGDIDILIATNIESVAQMAQERFLRYGVKVVAGPSKCSIYFEDKIRIDLLVVPAKHWGAAMLYFTGSKEHNIALRKRAARMGLTLNEFGLYKGRQMLAGETEEGIYAELGLKMHPPTRRRGSSLREIPRG